MITGATFFSASNKTQSLRFSFNNNQRRRQDFESGGAKGRLGKKVRGHHKTIKYAKLRHFSFHGLFCIFQNWSVYEMAQTLLVFLNFEPISTTVTSLGF